MEAWRKGQRKTILVVEDADVIRKMVCAMLSQSGYRCLEAADGSEALTVLSSDPEAVQLVLTDVVMPNMSGAEFAKHVVRMRPDLRIIFMSGYSDDPVVRHVERIPTLFLAKPFTAATLMEKVEQSLERPWNGLPGIAC